MSRVYLIGAGPGDPGLITLRGARALALADVVLYDALAHPALLEHAREGAELCCVGKRYGEESFSQDAINAELVAHARAGRVVARLKGGDPLLFARGAEEAEVLAREGIPFEIIPGVPSPTGAAAYAGIPLTHRELSSSVAFITGTESQGKERGPHDWSKLATATETLCVVMGMKRLAEITAALVAHGRDPRTPAAAVQWGTWSKQRVIEGTVADIAARAAQANVANPAVVVIGEVAALRGGLRWFDRQPLFGKRIVVTRPAHQASETARQLRDRGAEPILAPAIAIAPPRDPGAVERALADLAAYDVVAFTSANGVDRAMNELRRMERDARAFGASKIAAIGPGTRDALARWGLRADLVAEEFRGEGLGRSIAAAVARPPASGAVPPRVLLLRAQKARDALPDALRAAGISVEVVSVYETRVAPALAMTALAADLEAGAVDAVTFTSSSTVAGVVEGLGSRARELLERAVIAVIGPITADTAREHGLRVDVAADPYTVPALLDALERRFASEAPGPP